jgi:uncharacterized cupin superfamily protein
MEKVTIDEVAPSGPPGSEIDRRALSDPLGTTDLAVNRYRLESGERFSGGLHAHMDQEELFAVVEGEATFETPDDEISVAAGEVIRFAPGEFQSGKNDSNDAVVAFALGAPRDSDDVHVPQDCPDCGHDTMRAIPADDGFGLVCPDCGTETDAAP